MPESIRSISYEEYATKLPSVRVSSLLEILTSPKQYRHALGHPRKDTASLRIGRSGHTAILEPMEFLRGYVLMPPEFPDAKGVMKPAKRSLKSCKEWCAEQEQAGKTILTDAEYNTALTMQNAVKSHPVASAMLAGGQNEVTITWKDPATLLDCKARLDCLKRDAIVDVKTTRHITPRAFGRDAANLNYHTRLAWYQDGHLAATGRDKSEEPAVWRLPVFIVAVQNEPPHDVAVYRVPDDALEAGRQRYQGLMQTLSACLAADEWPGVADEVVDLEFPAWATASVNHEEMQELML